MKLQLSLVAFILSGTIPFTTSAGGGTNITTQGSSCSPNLVNSSGNTIILQCVPGSSPPTTNDFRVVVGYTSATPIIDGNINWMWVDKSNSELVIRVDGHSKVDTSLNQAFQDKVLTLSRGQHTFEIEVTLAYYPFPTGFQAQDGNSSCTVVLDVQAPGKIYPKYVINQDNTGQLYTYACNFWI
ncbi:TPA: hypothetical protein ACTW2S_005548 [Raoultella planticola]|uniref:Secreted protein n=1 Tax=Raoultella terrigena TaxID=577 RepID=A0A7Z9CT88_RAOTE|nr:MULTISPECIES: hypothetical protein [Klebsiella/Raoultella group]VED51061.1 Uncharacterised protein [Raoultella terrigena]HBR7308621.1 hypothetical protein [Klebsiella aerogenes]HDU3858864.1 hypothetical protein [Klebsiella quasipneumoniae subsp. quasipneumoniae]MBE0016958.1 hypothetical protein [Raoultella planticola]MCX2983581.1 hypothetical protein [Klebsiella pneumoniae]